eukprot:scaffold71697_cov51-Phaeocystis_antarctica.AAC.2
MTREAINATLRNLPARSSRATGPETRVPTGPERSRFMRTAAFSWKRTVVPSLRVWTALCRTTTAATISFRETRPSGLASLTDARTALPRVAGVLPK